MEDKSSAIALYRRNENVLVRTSTPSDAYTISEYFQKNKAFLKPWEPKRDEAFYQADTWAAKLVKLDELHRLGLAYYCLIFDTDTKEMKGTVSLSNLVRFPLHSCNLGYSLAEDAQGQGYMRGALSMVLPYMFDVQNMHRITASYMPHNMKSAAVLDAMGFKKEGYAKDYLLIDDRWQDHIQTALINPNWRSR
ncbi:ribosomal-protein-alanine acetyltransferase [Vibrio sp. 10N.286.49.C2]|uniref:ribosomal protein S5-alanine N-acetyltransferase n=1 Tax=unclassified Vibrio TaxID=2614977 RepID=UPI000C831DCF|nr:MULTISPECIES: ribosomal protein S5-alanine N-acetyltransferase [unclassified Vibrio]PMH31501.1 ribosomal-protein-alanine acetyltransferase [Vibrio sp. 10N.286.49.C2]PMH50522.1 ribosomal-protein-alanine acetyltransferase [Vibrio sp. 10N.286.49.B1]PMH77996.1 ribosomal-protein-alanine acetyltransferase [Vibrio sp. 10N.286.48.B7]